MDKGEVGGGVKKTCIECWGGGRILQHEECETNWRARIGEHGLESTDRYFKGEVDKQQWSDIIYNSRPYMPEVNTDPKD